MIDDQKSETLVIDRDSTGAIWATWVQENGGGQHHVYVKQTDGNCVAQLRELHLRRGRPSSSAERLA